MLPTLPGRIQTRLAMLATWGSIVTLIVIPLLPPDGPLGRKYEYGFIVLAAVAVLGIGWECVYHFLMQWRWEKDWPTFFGFATFVNEGALLYVLARLELIPGIHFVIPAVTFWVQFMVVWMVIWLWTNGPMRVFTIHWRFRGGRLA